MMGKWKENYFYKIFMSIFCVCLILALIICSITGITFWRFYQTNLGNQCIDATKKIRDVMEKMEESYIQELTELSVSQDIKVFLEDAGNISSEKYVNAVKKELYIYKNSFAEKVSISIVRLSDKKWISTTKQELEDSHADFSGWGVFRKANETAGAAVYSIARDSLLSEKTRFCIAIAVRNTSKEILGYLLLEIPRTTIDEVIREYSNQYNTSTLILNKSNSVIYHSGGTAKEGLGKGEMYGIERDNTSDSGITQLNYAYAQSNIMKLFFLQEIPAGTVGMLMKTILLAMIPGMLAIVLLALFFARILAKSVCDPINEMIITMEKVEKGDLSVRVNFQLEDEIGQLGRAFDSMTCRISDLMERIDEEKHSLWIAETRSLSLQMNPHFLYNTLDIIKWNAKLNRNKEIVDTTVLLGRVLRRIMNTKTDIVTVAYELEIVEAFVEIQKKHFGDRLTLELDVSESIKERMIPKLVIQPVVENAIVHGFSGQDGVCQIRVTGEEKDNLLIFCVEDNGSGMTSEELEHILEFRQEGSHHIGLNNVQRRLKMFGDESCGIKVESEYGKGTKVYINLKITDEEGER